MPKVTQPRNRDEGCGRALRNPWESLQQQPNRKSGVGHTVSALGEGRRSLKWKAGGLQEEGVSL